jgi:hypothetical protein
VHRLQAVAHVRQRAPDDHAHGVVEIRLAHLVFEIDRENFRPDRTITQAPRWASVDLRDGNQALRRR